MHCSACFVLKPSRRAFHSALFRHAACALLRTFSKRRRRRRLMSARASVGPDARKGTVQVEGKAAAEEEDTEALAMDSGSSRKKAAAAAEEEEEEEEPVAEPVADPDLDRC